MIAGTAHRGRTATAMLAALICVALPHSAAANSTRAYVGGEMLIRFERGADAVQREAALDEVGARTREQLFVPGLRLVELDAAVPAAVATAERAPGVLYAEPNFIDRFDAVPNDPDFGLQWALNNTGQTVNTVTGTPDADIDAVQAWDSSRGSPSTIVAIADTGVAYTHPDLAPNTYRNPGESGGGKETNNVDDDGNGYVDDFRGYDFLPDPTKDNNPAPSADPGANHGTTVAGAAGAQGNNSVGVTGASQEVDLMPLRVGNTSANIAAQIEAFGYARVMGAEVVNLSAGGANLSQARLDAIRAASNTLFVFSAGNGGADNLGDNNDASPVYPCNHAEPNVVCVAATTQNDIRGSFSNFGAATVDLAAPGFNIRTTNTPGPSYTFVSGTSFSAPITAGAAAVYRSHYPAATAAQTRDALRAGVDELTSLDNVVETDGRLNLDRTLDHDITPPDTAITRGPKKKLKTRKRRKKVRFEFSSTEPGSSFLCALDDKPETACTSPYKKKVRRGKHVFEVRARDDEGDTDPTPASRVWKLKRKRK